MTPVTGKHIFIGNAGESLVAGELLRRGVVAALAPRNTPHFDILATNGDTTVGVRAKTRSMRANSWLCRAQAPSEFKGNEWKRPIFPEKLAHDVVALVDLKDPDAIPPHSVEFWLVPSTELEQYLQQIFKVWMETPGKHGNKHNPDNFERRFGGTKNDIEWLEQYRNRWSLITTPLTEASAS